MSEYKLDYFDYCSQKSKYPRFYLVYSLHQDLTCRLKRLLFYIQW